MNNYSEYFDRISYKPKYQIGDRVFGHYKKIPFIGSVANDSLVSTEEGPRVAIHLDLPIHTEFGVLRFIRIRHRDIKSKLVQY